MEKLFRILLIIIIGAVFAAIGYMVAVPRRGPGDVHDVPRPPAAFSLRDLPLMPGMKPSAAIRGRDGKQWIMRVEAPATVDDVSQFYGVAMLQKGWRERPVETQDVEGERVLCFVKGRRKCIMRLEQKDSYTCVINMIVF